MGLDLKTWAMKWIEGSVISYVKGKTALNMVAGRIKKALNSYGLRIDEVIALMDVIENSPIYLPSLSRTEKAAKLKLIRDALMELYSNLLIYRE